MSRSRKVMESFMRGAFECSDYRATNATVGLEAELRAASIELFEWEPIESAPKDGTDVVLRSPHHMMRDHWSDVQESWFRWWSFTDDHPTHWAVWAGRWAP